LIPQGTVGQSNVTGTVRVEIDPDPSTIKANCTAAFKSALNSQLYSWLTSGLTNFLGSVPPLPKNQNFTTFIFKGEIETQHRQRLLKLAKEFSTSAAARTSKSEDEYKGNEPEPVAKVSGNNNNDNHERKLVCSWTSCTNCCLPFCISSCWSNNGGCGTTCNPGRRRVRAASRKLADLSWWTLPSVSSSVSLFLQMELTQWLLRYDLRQCLGNPASITAAVTFF